MTDMFKTLGTWNWLIFGFILMALELLAPGVFMFWLRVVHAHGANDSDRPLLNRRAERHVGEEIVLDEPITGGFGRVPIGDTLWRVAGPDLPAGRRIRIVGHDGPVLRVVEAEER
jgi:membrane protein implicated in regulation of membrane protease activity